ncbi:hypothetical protein ASPCAL14477 [Aspergillus calidoustus]|uniref:Uncharacterized protein n=1 Tax=Aspergillus calidoustus TaxID=454130 RepID=A0A0U5GKM9_ASPCI|nr:hypothetical protein ASPCAL14477 [Aspergillus calidoustus]
MSQRTRSPLEVLSTVQHKPFDEDVVVINDDKMLEECLGKCFPKPLLYLSTSKHASPITWANFWDYLQKNSNKKIDVYDYSILTESKRTQQRTVQKDTAARSRLLMLICLSGRYYTPRRRWAKLTPCGQAHMQSSLLQVLHGRKIFYFPRRVDSTSIRLLAQVGSQYVNGYIGGWARVELQAGDLL